MFSESSRPGIEKTIEYSPAGMWVRFNFGWVFSLIIPATRTVQRNGVDFTRNEPFPW